MNTLLPALKDSIFSKDWSYHGAQAAGTTTMYSDYFAEYFWILNLLLWGLKFYNEYRKAKKKQGEENEKPKIKSGGRTGSPRKRWYRPKKKS